MIGGIQHAGFAFLSVLAQAKALVGSTDNLFYETANRLIIDHFFMGDLTAELAFYIGTIWHGVGILSGRTLYPTLVYRSFTSWSVSSNNGCGSSVTRSICRICNWSIWNMVHAYSNRCNHSVAVESPRRIITEMKNCDSNIVKLKLQFKVELRHMRLL